MNPITRLEEWQKQIDQLKARYDETMDCSDEWEADRLQLKYDAYKQALEDARKTLKSQVDFELAVDQKDTLTRQTIMDTIDTFLTIPEEE